MPLAGSAGSTRWQLCSEAILRAALRDSSSTGSFSPRCIANRTGLGRSGDLLVDPLRDDPRPAHRGPVRGDGPALVLAVRVRPRRQEEPALLVEVAEPERPRHARRGSRRGGTPARRRTADAASPDRPAGDVGPLHGRHAELPTHRLWAKKLRTSTRSSSLPLILSSATTCSHRAGSRSSGSAPAPSDGRTGWRVPAASASAHPRGDHLREEQAGRGVGTQRGRVGRHGPRLLPRTPPPGRDCRAGVDPVSSAGTTKGRAGPRTPGVGSGRAAAVFAPRGRREEIRRGASLESMSLNHTWATRTEA